MALSDVFVALQTGVIDGQENPLAQIWASRLHEVQSYLSLTGHVYTPAFLVTSPSRWQELPEEVRSILEEEARATQEFVYETAARLDGELLERLEEGGVQVNVPEQSMFLEEASAIREQFAESVSMGAQLLEKAEAAGAQREQDPAA